MRRHGASDLIAARGIDVVFLGSPGMPTSAPLAGEYAPAPVARRYRAQGRLRGGGQCRPWATIPVVPLATTPQLPS
jgi:hypothetical protein